MIRKSLFLVSIAIFVLTAVAFANKCTEAIFRMSAVPFMNEISDYYLDSSYTKTTSQKYIYENGRPVEVHEKGEKDQVLYFYYDTDETPLKNRGTEYIFNKCENQDTLCYIQKIYINGDLHKGTLTIKVMPDYISQEIDEPYYHDSTEHFLYPDSIIESQESYELGQDQYYKLNMSWYKLVIVADSTDDTKCYSYRTNRYQESKLDGTWFYTPNENGYSIGLSVVEGTISSEYFFIDATKTTAIHKIAKPVKISPKARYFDLLGRYRFSK